VNLLLLATFPANRAVAACMIKADIYMNSIHPY